MPNPAWHSTSRKRIIDGAKASWTDERRKKHSELQKIAWSGEAGEIRRKKIFTPEFGHKISLANMRRGFTRKSKAESRFVNHLKSIFGEDNVIASKWFNFEIKTWCADAYIVDKATIVEFDGIYWHAKDQVANLTETQAINVTNDIIKNSLARDEGFNLIRIYEDVDLSSIKTNEDLIFVSHHYVKQGKVIKDSTIILDDPNALSHLDQDISSLLLEAHDIYWNSFPE